MKYLFWFLLILNMNYCQAAIYTQTDSSGTEVYSDIPLSPNSKQVDMPNAAESQISTEKIETTDSTTDAATHKLTKKPYTVFEISSPANEETIQNQPVIPVKLHIEPELQKGDTIQLSLDGKLVGEPVAATNFNLDLLERGEHQLSATLFDENKTVLKQSSSITIFIHRASVNQPSQQANH